MLSDVPNLAICVGYTNASWTLRADISSQEVCNVLNHLDQHGYRYATPTVRECSSRGRSSTSRRGTSSAAWA